MKESAWSGKNNSRLVVVSEEDDLGIHEMRQQVKKNFTKDLANVINAWKSIIRNRPTHATMENWS